MAKKNKAKQSNLPTPERKKPNLNHPIVYAKHTWSNNRTKIGLAAILIISFIAFLPVLSAEFTNWDDNLYVTENPYLVKFSMENVVNIFTHQTSGNYNPLPIFTHLIERSLFGLEAFWYHFNNLWLHLLATALVFWFMLLLRANLMITLMVTALFGFHPMRVESVAWITERKDVLFAVFYIGAMISYIYYRSQKVNKTKYLISLYVLFILSAFSKIQAVSLPLSLLAIDYYFKRPLKFNLIVEKIPMFLISLTFGLIGVFILGSKGSINATTGDFTLFDKLLFAPHGLLMYVYKVFVPYPLATYYPYPDKVNGLLPMAYYISPFILAAMLWGIWKSTQHTRVVAFGTFFFLVNIMFLLQVVSAGEAYLADRFTYIAYIGLFFVLAEGIDYLLKEKSAVKQATMGILGLYLVGLLGMTFQQSKTWQNSETLWTNVVDHYPRVAVAYNNRGNYYRDKGQQDKALAEYSKALEVRPNYDLAYNNRGNVYFGQNQNDLALADYIKTLELNPGNEKALNNRGSVYYRKGQYDEAAKDYNAAIQLDALYTDAYLNRAVLYATIGQHQKAVEDFNFFLKYRPDHAQAIGWRGISKREIGQLEAALQDFNTSLQLKPNDAGNLFHRSLTYQKMGNKQAALQDALKARQLGMKVNEEYLESLK
ncbi:MAG: tetratricopeptide repeat protein [Chitinophagales bacterium]